MKAPETAAGPAQTPAEQGFWKGRIGPHRRDRVRIPPPPRASMAFGCSSFENDGGVTLGPHLRGQVGVQGSRFPCCSPAIPPDGPA